MGQTPVCVGLGEVLWDLMPDGKQLGGAPANFAYHAAALGARGGVASCVGDDPFGREILLRLDELGLDRSAVAVDGEHPTGTVSVELNEQGEPDYLIHEDVAWDFIPWERRLLDWTADADVVCFGSLAQRSSVSRRSIRRFLAAAGPRCLRIFDANLRQDYYDRDVIDGSLASSDVLKLNDEELPVLAGLLGVPASPSAALDEIIRRYSLRLVVLTKGPAGSVLRSAEAESVLPGDQVQVADTVGAGDAFTAAIAVGLSLGRDLQTMHRYAARLAAYVCTQAGATPAVPDELRAVNALLGR